LAFSPASSFLFFIFFYLGLIKIFQLAPLLLLPKVAAAKAIPHFLIELLAVEFRCTICHQQDPEA
jgi:hypothetical protein